jgi:dolichol-phosphate mannosyltransferase
MKLSIVIPAHNEEDNIVETINKIESSLDMPHELVVVNDHSTDSTARLVEGLSEKYHNIKLVENLSDPGFANAIKAGFINSSFDAVIPVMADLCDDLDTINRMFRKLSEGYDIVCGSRYIKGGTRLEGPKFKGFLSCFAGWSLHYLLGVPVHDIANAFKMYRKKVLDGIVIESRGFEISMELPLKAYYSGVKMTEVPTI